MKDKPVPWPPSFAPPAFDARRYEWSLWQLEILKHLHFIQAGYIKFLRFVLCWT
jgi:hypothetical protein